MIIIFVSIIIKYQTLKEYMKYEYLHLTVINDSLNNTVGS